MTKLNYITFTVLLGALTETTVEIVRIIHGAQDIGTEFRRDQAEGGE